MKTWIYESTVVASILILTAYFSKGGPVEWIGAAAVFCAFNYAQISDRLAERQRIKERPEVECHRKLFWYFFAKELLWFSYFILHHSYSALVGVFVFLAYPIWRKLWRHWHPIGTS